MPIYLHICPDLAHRSSDLTHRSSDLTHRSSDLTHRSSYLTHRSSDLTHRSSHLTHRRSRHCLPTCLSVQTPLTELSVTPNHIKLLPWSSGWQMPAYFFTWKKKAFIKFFKKTLRWLNVSENCLYSHDLNWLVGIVIDFQCFQYKWLRVSEANEVPVLSHIWVASTTFK